MVPNAEAEPAQKCVLVVDDEVLIRMLVADELRQAGLRVIEARSGDDALAVLKAGSSVDLVFSDVQMPGSVDGVQLAREIRARYPHLPVILGSGNNKLPDLAGARGFVQKPYEISVVIGLVQRMLGLDSGNV